MGAVLQQQRDTDTAYFHRDMDIHIQYCIFRTRNNDIHIYDFVQRLDMHIALVPVHLVVVSIQQCLVYMEVFA